MPIYGGLPIIPHPFMAPPTFIKGIGRLSTDRFDFQSHVDGTTFRHNATQTDTTITINGHTYATVADALNAIATILNTPPPPAFTAGGDLSGTAFNQKVIGLDGYQLANTVPVQSAVPVYDTNVSKYDIRKLTLDDLGPAFTITSFTGGSTVEIGATVVNPAFAATYSSPASSAHITNTDNIGSPLTLITPFTSGTVVGSFHHTSQTSVTFTLTAIGATTQNATQLITYLPRSFGGVGAAGATSSVTASGNTAILSNGTVLANEGLHSSDIGQVYGPFVPSSQKIYLLLIGGGHTFKDNGTGFAFPMNSPTAVSFTNQNGAVVSMSLYESTNTISGTFNLLVFT